MSVEWRVCLDSEKKTSESSVDGCTFVRIVINVTRNKEANVVRQLAARDTPTHSNV